MTISPAKTTLIYVMESNESQDRETRSGPKNMPSAGQEEMSTGLEEKRVCDVMLTHDGFTANFRTKIAKENINIGNDESPKLDQVNFHPNENSGSNNQDDGYDDDDGFTNCCCCCVMPRRGKHKAEVSYVKTDDSLRTVGCSTADRNTSKVEK